MPPSTARASLRAGCKTVIDGVQAANPTLLAHTYDHTPESFRTPCAYVANGIRTVRVQHDASTRMRDLEAEVHFVNKLTRHDQAAEEQDSLGDLAEDAFTANPRATSSASLTEHTRAEPHEHSDGTATYACTIVFVQGRFIEGRL